MHPRAKAHFIAELAEGNRRAAKHRDCPRCGAPILVGDDHDTVAVVATVDADPVDRAGEMLAVLDGRYTCDLVKRNLHARNDSHINSTRVYGSIHVEHRCTTERPRP